MANHSLPCPLQALNEALHFATLVQAALCRGGLYDPQLTLQYVELLLLISAALDFSCLLSPIPLLGLQRFIRLVISLSRTWSSFQHLTPAACTFEAPLRRIRIVFWSTQSLKIFKPSTVDCRCPLWTVLVLYKSLTVDGVVGNEVVRRHEEQARFDSTDLEGCNSAYTREDIFFPR